MVARGSGGRELTRRTRLIAVHRWVSLVAALLWSVQALSGLFAVFHWEIDDATIAGAERAVDFAALERRARELAAAEPGLAIGSIWTSAGSANRFDIYLDAAADLPGKVVRVDGAGSVLRIRTDGEPWTNGGWVERLVVLHQSLSGGDAGRWIVGGSGLLLLANLVAGARLAWPRSGQWRRALLPAALPAGAPRLYAWHRALGLWALAPAACLIGAGVLLAFDSAAERLLAVPTPTPPALVMPAGAVPAVDLAESVRIALARFPGAVVSGISFPTAAEAWWGLRLRQPGELRRAYGKTRVHVSALDGTVGAQLDALHAPPARRFLDSLFSFHSGEIGGLPGRLATTGVGLWLAAMNFLGLRLWWVRRGPRGGRPQRPEGRSAAG
jgi:uncharacterized iron-regulated membrane protein